MMKTMKKVLATLVSLAMACMFVTPVAIAEDPTYTITMNGVSGHTYDIYQVFTGDFDINDSGKTLSNIEWGAGVSSTAQAALGSASAKAATLTDAATASAFAKTLVETEGYLGTAVATEVASNGSVTGQHAGYYLVKDHNAATGDYAVTAYILQVVGSITVNVKGGNTPTPSKTVSEESATATGAAAVSAKPGDEVWFTLTATLPSDLSSYSTYKLVFNDTLSSGLTLDADSVAAYIGENTIDASAYTKSVDGQKLALTFADVKAAPVSATDGSVITVKYKATVADISATGAKIGANNNDFYLDYSNDPNKDTTGTSETVEAKVYTYQLTISKTDGTSSPLKGAGFTLYWLPMQDSEPTDWSSATSKEIKSATTNPSNNSNLDTFTFTGLEDGWYKIVETQTPSGYSTADDIIFKVTDTFDASGALTALESSNTKVSANATTYSMATTVVNNAGSNLPSTGGMGTMIFTAVGLLLILGAGVGLVIRYRRKQEQC